MAGFRFGISPKTDEPEEHYLLVIGESARYDRFHINGYDRDTSPSLDTTANLIDLLRHQSGIRALVYVSDHGENLFDDERKYSFHGTYEGTEYEAHVPCFIWLSEEYKSAYPEKVLELGQNLHKQVQSDVLFYSLADLGGLRGIVDPEKSLFSSELQQQDTVRMITGNGDVKVIKVIDSKEYVGPGN